MPTLSSASDDSSKSNNCERAYFLYTRDINRFSTITDVRSIVIKICISHANLPYEISRTRIGMRSFELLLHAGLIFTTAAAFCEDSGNSSITTVAPVLPGNVLPLHYDIQLKVPHPKKHNVSFYGKSDISLVIRCVTRNIGLHSLGMVINETATKLTNTDRLYYRPIYYNYDFKKHIVIITFDELKPGRYKLYVKFVGTTPKLYEYELVNFYRQSYKSKEGNSVLIARMPFMPVVIREDFPCWDQSPIKVTFIISVKHHLRYTALSYSKPVQVVPTEQEDMVWTHFPNSSPMSTCAMMVVVLDFVHVSNKKKIINLWCRPHLKSHVKFAHDVAENVTRHMSQYLKYSRNILKMDDIAVPKFALRESAYWGINIYNEQDIIYNDKIHPTFRMIDVAKKVAREVVHQWFGVLVNPSWWSDMWLNEGFASFLHTYILNKMFEKWRLMDFLVIKNLQESLHADSIAGLLDSNSSAVRNPYNYYFNSALYDKAPVILRFLQHIMTDEVFWKGIVIYLNYHIFVPVTFDSLWIAMQLALDKSNILHRDFRIKEVMDSWLNNKQYPLVTVMRNYETGKTIISQKHFHLRKNEEDDVINEHKWWIPVTFATQTNPDFSDTFSNYWLSPLDHNISFQTDPNDWIIVNLQQVGYYRVNYDSTNWRKIANYLNSGEYTKIHVLNRAQIIDDAYVFLMEKQLDIFTFLNLTNYLSRETDYVAWYPMFRILSLLMQFFSFPESKAFKLHMANIFTGLLKNVGYEEKLVEDDLMKLKRLDAIKWACIVGNSKCKQMATVKLDKHLTNPDVHKISLWWQKWIYCSGLMAANITIWNKVMDLYLQKHSIIFLEFLACSENPNIIINYLNIIASNDLITLEIDRDFAFTSILSKHASNNLILDYILENFEQIKSKLITTDRILKNLIFNLYSEEQLYKIKKFIKCSFEGQSRIFKMQHLINSRLDELRIMKADFWSFISKDQV